MLGRGTSDDEGGEREMNLGRLRRRRGGVIDRRGQGGFGGGGGFPLGGTRTGGAGLPLPGGAGGLVAVIVLVVLVVVIGRTLLSGGGGLGDALDPFGSSAAVAPGSAEPQADPDDAAGAFIDAVADDIQLTWIDLFERAGLRYEPTSVVLFDGRTSTACGPASSAVGPFYCPADRLV